MCTSLIPSSVAPYLVFVLCAISKGLIKGALFPEAVPSPRKEPHSVYQLMSLLSVEVGIKTKRTAKLTHQELGIRFFRCPHLLAIDVHCNIRPALFKVIPFCNVSLSLSIFTSFS